MALEDPGIVALVQEKLAFKNRERWYRLVVQRKKRSREQGFFDKYPHFLSSDTRAEPDRLNQRYRAVIESNVEAIRGRRILDLASHDGRWGLPARLAGAEYVLGIEARGHLVEESRRNMEEYGITGVEFTEGDVLVELDRLGPGQFDTVLCLGFLYHTSDHMTLLRKIGRLRPSFIVIDTAISVRQGDLIEIRYEGTHRDAMAAIAEIGRDFAVVGQPTKTALELMLKAIGFPSVKYYDWHNSGITRWDDLKDYYLGTRITATATRA